MLLRFDTYKKCDTRLRKQKSYVEAAYALRLNQGKLPR
jgi:hypothetical protein